jgi:hypothetical protein
VLRERVQLPRGEQPQPVVVGQHAQQATQVHVLEPVHGALSGALPHRVHHVQRLAQRPAHLAHPVHGSACADHDADPPVHAVGDLLRDPRAVVRRADGEWRDTPNPVRHGHVIAGVRRPARAPSGARACDVTERSRCSGVARSAPPSSLPAHA